MLMKLLNELSDLELIKEYRKRKYGSTQQPGEPV
jgi:hypothetical protein